MDTKGRNLGRAYLVSKLRERGLSRRGALRVLNVIFEEMSKELSRGRSVEFPYGKLHRVKKRFGKRWDDYDDWPADRQRYTVEWELDEAGWKLLEGEEPRKSGRVGLEKLVNKLRVRERIGRAHILGQAVWAEDPENCQITHCGLLGESIPPCFRCNFPTALLMVSWEHPSESNRSGY
jgi:hypothetical protein